MGRKALWGFVVPAFALAQPAAAQVVWDMPNVVVQKPKFAESTIRSRADAWPRLDPGAVICKTEDDLLRLTAARRGEQVGRAECQLIRVPTAISIEKRDGPGRTQVSLTDQNGLNGWTDAWLPERVQPIGGRGVSIK